MPSGYPPHGSGAGDEPVRGGWGIKKAAVFLFGFSFGVYALLEAVGAPIPDLGIGGLLNTIAMAFVALAVVGIVLFVVRVVYTMVDEDAKLL